LLSVWIEFSSSRVVVDELTQRRYKRSLTTGHALSLVLDSVQ